MLQKGHVDLRLREEVNGFTSGFEVFAAFFDAVSLAVIEFVNIAAFKCLGSSVVFLLATLFTIRFPIGIPLRLSGVMFNGGFLFYFSR
jgi:predicted membrane channel-forming protein YqfA (hemolysin III family)